MTELRNIISVWICDCLAVRSHYNFYFEGVPENMVAKIRSDPHLEIAHVLFVDVVGYSRLLVNEQREVVQQLNEIVRAAPQFRQSSAAGKLIRIATGDGMALVFSRVRKNRCIVQWKLPKR